MNDFQRAEISIPLLEVEEELKKLRKK